jgi:hypothetical protein
MRTFRIAVLAVGMLLLAGCNMLQHEAAPPPAGLRVHGQAPTDYPAGPGDAYDLVGVLQPGQEFEVVGVSAAGDYLAIRDPSNVAVISWLKSQAAVFSASWLAFRLPPRRAHPHPPGRPRSDACSGRSSPGPFPDLRRLSEEDPRRSAAQGRLCATPRLLRAGPTGWVGWHVQFALTLAQSPLPGMGIYPCRRRPHTQRSCLANIP